MYVHVPRVHLLDLADRITRRFVREKMFKGEANFYVGKRLPLLRYVEYKNWMDLHNYNYVECDASFSPKDYGLLFYKMPDGRRFVFVPKTRLDELVLWADRLGMRGAPFYPGQILTTAVYNEYKKWLKLEEHHYIECEWSTPPTDYALFCYRLADTPDPQKIAARLIEQIRLLNLSD